MLLGDVMDIFEEALDSLVNLGEMVVLLIFLLEISIEQVKRSLGFKLARQSEWLENSVLHAVT